jgi:hypothetical protein
MKKALFLAIGLLFGIASVVAAQPAVNYGNVASTNQQGSVLIFPKIVVTGETDTFITISNGSSAPVNVECTWIPYNWPATVPYIDFQITLTPNQPFAFDAFFGGQYTPAFPTGYQNSSWVSVSTVGELKCWATDANYANQINFNWLTGTAKVVDFCKYTAYEYNAWTFRALTGTNGAAVGAGGNIALDGVNFQACPQYFLGNFFGAGADYGLVSGTDITLVPCKQDLREEKQVTVTKAKFDFWGANETGFSGAIQCVTNWFEGCLGGIINSPSLVCSAARFRVTGIASQDCPGSQASPLIGLIIEDLNFFSQPSTAAKAKTTQSIVGGSCALTASTGFGAGISDTGFIKWDALGAPVSAKKK